MSGIADRRGAASGLPGPRRRRLSLDAGVTMKAVGQQREPFGTTGPTLLACRLVLCEAAADPRRVLVAAPGEGEGQDA